VLFRSIYAPNIKSMAQKMGQYTPDTCSTLAGFGLLFKDQNRNAEAAEMLLRALDGRKNVFGVDHPATIRTKEQLESVQRQQEGERE
jgi:hypothetical protein